MHHQRLQGVVKDSFLFAIVLYYALHGATNAKSALARQQFSRVGFRMDNSYLRPFLSSTGKTAEISGFSKNPVDISHDFSQNHVGGALFEQQKVGLCSSFVKRMRIFGPLAMNRDQRELRSRRISYHGGMLALPAAWLAWKVGPPLALPKPLSFFPVSLVCALAGLRCSFNWRRKRITELHRGGVGWGCGSQV